MQERVQDYQVLIHSMAVSDYTPVYMTGLEEVQASSNLKEFLSKQNHQAKISSTDEVQVLFLKKTPKIISLVKEWNPTIHLIGFIERKTMANILLAVTGSIASYKSADLVSSLKKQGHQVTVLMTQAATEFIQPLTLQVLSQNPVHLDVMKEPYPDQVNHIELGKKADL
ncbi:phosphopantothenate--cysteine ligase [Streptococcus pneumoniae]|nr:phosphopantothenate--cysteine ligase [Streptococcus pneumoniae]